MQQLIMVFGLGNATANSQKCDETVEKNQREDTPFSYRGSNGQIIETVTERRSEKDDEAAI